MKKISLWIYLTLILSIVFSLFSVSFKADISLLAFPLSFAFTAITCWFLYFKFYKNKDFLFFKTSFKLLEYLPYVLLCSFIVRRAGKTGTCFWYDIVTVLLWCAILVSRKVLLYYISPKRVLGLEPSWKKYEQKLSEKYTGKKRLVYEVLSWIDAILQVVFMLLLFQIFILQLYVIPSESMVPTFLVNDRVAVCKVASGPKFPLTEVGLPTAKNYKRGDIVVFRNPHYSMDRKSEVKTVVGQIVSMLTFTKVNINVDSRGNPKADPLVKRICGIPGEQLMMQDGILYSRTSENSDFKPVQFDSKYAAWNLNSESEQLKRKIQILPLSKEDYELMLEIEHERNSLNVEELSEQCKELAEKFRQVSTSKSKISGNFSFNMNVNNALENVQSIMISEGACSWFENFMTSWIKDFSLGLDFKGDLYAQANYKLNLMLKKSFGSYVVRYAQLLNVPSYELANDSELINCAYSFRKLLFYCSLLDQRNMPVFPENTQDGSPSYIPQNCYFMMGDNRFNSLDMRHSYKVKNISLTKFDSYSFEYPSNMEPRYVNKKFILGFPFLRIWPLSRFGKIK